MAAGSLARNAPRLRSETRGVHVSASFTGGDQKRDGRHAAGKRSVAGGEGQWQRGAWLGTLRVSDRRRAAYMSPLASPAESRGEMGGMRRGSAQSLAGRGNGSGEPGSERSASQIGDARRTCLR